MRPTTLRSALFSAVIALLMCAVPPPAAQAGQDEQSPEEQAVFARLRLSMGMSAGEVHDKLGEPAKKRALTAMEGTELQDWIYANGLILHFTNGVLKGASLLQ